MYTLVGKLALVAALAFGTYLSEGILAPVQPAAGKCPFRDAFSCCVYSCQHDSSTGCQGSARCCENLCR